MTVSDVATQGLTTLAADTGVLTGGPVMTRGGKLLSVRGSFSIKNLTAGDGPFLVGLADKGIDLTQLEAYLENDGPVTPDETAKAEIASRGARIRTLGVLQPMGDGTTASLYLDNASLKGLKFSEENAGWNSWLYNLGDALTTGSSLRQVLQFFAEFNPSG